MWQNCGVYDQPVEDSQAVHSMEHGAVWITYQPDLPAEQVDQLRDLVGGSGYVLLSPYVDLPRRVRRRREDSGAGGTLHGGRRRAVDAVGRLSRSWLVQSEAASTRNRIVSGIRSSCSSTSDGKSVVMSVTR